MKMKWKIYYACSLYLFLWSAAMIGVFIYGEITNGYKQRDGIDNNDIAIIIVMLAICLSVNIMSIFALRFIGYFKNFKSYSKIEGIFFNIFYAVNVFLTGVSFFGLTFSILPEDIHQAYLPRMQIIQTIGLSLATVFAIYLCSLSPLLVKGIRKNHYNSIETIGQHIQP